MGVELVTHSVGRCVTLKKKPARRFSKLGISFYAPTNERCLDNSYSRSSPTLGIASRKFSHDDAMCLVCTPQVSTVTLNNAALPQFAISWDEFAHGFGFPLGDFLILPGCL